MSNVLLLHGLGLLVIPIYVAIVVLLGWIHEFFQSRKREYPPLSFSGRPIFSDENENWDRFIRGLESRLVDNRREPAVNWKEEGF